MVDSNSNFHIECGTRAAVVHPVVIGGLGTAGYWLGRKAVEAIPDSRLSQTVQALSGLSASAVENGLIVGVTFVIAACTFLGGVYITNVLSSSEPPIEHYEDQFTQCLLPSDDGCLYYGNN